MNLIFLMLKALGFHKDALRLSRVAIEFLRNSEGPHDFHTLHVETWFVLHHYLLFRGSEVKQLSNDLYAREIKYLGPGHQYTRITELITKWIGSGKRVELPLIKFESPISQVEPQSELQ